MACHVGLSLFAGNTFLEREFRMANSQHNPLDGRDRDENGEIRRKNGATKVGTLREIYGDDFAPGARSDMKLDNLLKREGAQSLSDLLKRKK